MKSIADIAAQKLTRYKNQYIKWSLENPGQIMMGALSKETGADYALHCETTEELDVLIKIFKSKWKAASQENRMNGFKWIIEALQEIKDEYTTL